MPERSWPDLARNDATGVDAEVEAGTEDGVLASSVLPDERECLEVNDAGVRMPCRACAALHRPAADEGGIADLDALAEPGVLDVRLAAVEFDEHAEAPSIDGLAGDLAQPVDGALAEECEGFDVVAAQRVGGLHQLERPPCSLGEDGGEGALDDAPGRGAECEEVGIDLLAEAHLVVGEHGLSLAEGEASGRGVVLRRDAEQCP